MHDIAGLAQGWQAHAVVVCAMQVRLGTALGRNAFDEAQQEALSIARAVRTIPLKSQERTSEGYQVGISPF